MIIWGWNSVPVDIRWSGARCIDATKYKQEEKEAFNVYCLANDEWDVRLMKTLFFVQTDAAVSPGIRPATGKLRITITITPQNERGCLRND